MWESLFKINLNQFGNPLGSISILLTFIHTFDCAAMSAAPDNKVHEKEAC